MSGGDWPELERTELERRPARRATSCSPRRRSSPLASAHEKALREIESARGVELSRATCEPPIRLREVAVRDEQIADLVGSVSWRLTRPLRVLKARLVEPLRERRDPRRHRCARAGGRQPSRSSLAAVPSSISGEAKEQSASRSCSRASWSFEDASAFVVVDLARGTPSATVQPLAADELGPDAVAVAARVLDPEEQVVFDGGCVRPWRRPHPLRRAPASRRWRRDGRRPPGSGSTRAP